MKNPLDGIDIDSLIAEAKSIPPTKGQDLNCRDALYFTDPFINDRHTLAALLLLFDRVFIFRNFSQYISQPLMEDRGDRDTSADHLVDLLQQRINERQLKGPKARDVFSSELATIAQDKSILLFQKEIMPLWKEGLVYSINAEILPKTIIADKWEALKLTIQHDHVHQEWVKKTPQLKKIIPPGKTYIDGPLFLFHRMFSSMWGLNFAFERGLTPVTDNEILFNTAIKTYKLFLAHPLGKGSAVTDADFFISNLASISALRALKEFVPALGSMDFELILELREKTKDERGVFLDEVESLVRQTRMASFDRAPEDISPYVNEMVERIILPPARQLSKRIEIEREKLTSKLLRQFFIAAPALSLLAQSSSFSAFDLTAAFIAYGGKNLVDIRDYKIKLEKTKQDLVSSSLLFTTSKACVRDGQGFKEIPKSYYGIDPRIVTWNNHK